MSEFHHIPVLFDEVITGLAIKPGGTYVDCTVGGGGHAQGILAKAGDGGLLIGIDRDPAALEAAQRRLQKGPGRFVLVHSNYTELDKVLAAHQIDGVDGFLFDLGVSSHQLDMKDRGFSYHQDAALDMRMNPQASLSAYDVVNGYSERELARIIGEYGEERWAKRIAEFIVARRQTGPITTTGQLVDIIKAAVPASARRLGPHPARRTFQAIRIEVNGELEGIKPAIISAIDHLKPGGRICVISFHSLEDRIVKQSLQESAKGCVCPKDLPVCTCGNVPKVRLITRKPITAGQEELATNPRARSAKLRVAERL
ncbi:MAG: 16S rRNA (cytosine(1402)-N(4))-methyltransferase RsmH [Firmicutes bacterium]|nr:16S rRNA (cytosine(1402)-N(4))-methyltransferase RsmH [Bacillota bacterium]